MANEMQRNVAVISQDDLDRIKRTCYGLNPQEQEHQYKQTMRQTLHEKSKARAKAWGTSVEEVRKRKELERYQAFEAEELARREVDGDPPSRPFRNSAGYDGQTP